MESAPGKLSKIYDFEPEQSAVKAALGIGDKEKSRWKLLKDPTLGSLAREVSGYQPDVIHLSGCDNHEAMELLSLTPDDKQDGMVLRRDGGGPHLVPAQQLARALVGFAPPDGQTDEPPPPPEHTAHLLVANYYNSAARVGALAVAEGIGAALGFQDTIDNTLAELFVVDFYSMWRRSDWDLFAAFEIALDGLKKRPRRMLGSGVVLWSERSLVRDDEAQQSEVKKAHDKLEEQSSQIVPADLPALRQAVEVNIRVRERLNYSLLHNDTGHLFESFGIIKKVPERMLGVEVEVVLFVGGDSFPFKKVFHIEGWGDDLKDKVSVPLTSEFIRSVPEPIRTSLYVEVSYQGTTILRETYPVTLLPVDEWVDDDLNRVWLPSFVLPRDPAVARIIDAAQRHLTTLTDDRAAGFDGYQSVLGVAEDEDRSGVDLQAWAIWSALAHDFGVGYINPPPTYTKTGQRLRTPSQVLHHCRGTCIDLALLLAACLEYIDLYPVLFLIEGHAFAGYWRSDTAYRRYLNVDVDRPSIPQGAPRSSSRLAQTGGPRPWVLSQGAYSEILQYVFGEELFPIEAVGLTTHGSFWTAIDQGVEDLRSVSEFHSLIDVRGARRRFVTPLPIVENARSLDVD